MSRLLFALVSLLFAAQRSAAVDLTKPIPTVALADGRVMKNVTFANYRADTVLMRYAGGAMAIRYEFLPADVRAAVEEKRPGGPRTPAADTGAKTISIAGQCFVQTQGAGSYIFGNVTVYAFDLEYLKTWETTNALSVKLPAPITEAVTDAQGRFKLSIPENRPYFIFAQAQRTVGGHIERLEWHVPNSEIKPGVDLLLSNAPWRVTWRQVDIETAR